MKAILCISSNLPKPQATDKLLAAIELLVENDCPCLRDSGTYVVDTPYLNQIVEIDTKLDYDSLNALCKDIERRLGRQPWMKAKHICPIDIDAVIYDGAITRPRDFSRPFFQHGLQMLMP